jgi:hypothetical protein
MTKMTIERMQDSYGLKEESTSELLESLKQKGYILD